MLESNNMNELSLMEKIVSLAKRRGFIFPGSEIYGGLAGTYDYGPLGVALKRQIQNSWVKHFVESRGDMYQVDADIIMNPRVWEASGHVATFADPLVDDMKTKKRYRADHLLEEVGVDPKGMTIEQMTAVIREKGIKSPDGNELSEVRQFNMMFPIKVGASEDSSSVAYLRAETAPGMFVNFKNILDTFHPRLPFGMAQIGKAFRNEINPRDFIFRLREMEQMEIEYFCHPEKWEETFESWRKEFRNWMESIGLPGEAIHEVEIGEGDRAHYSKRTIDFEFDFPMGQKELAGLVYRSDFDLKQHSEYSKVDLSYFDEDTKERYLPHCIEPSIGVERVLLAVLASAYKEEEVNGETRTVLAFSPRVAPVQIAVLPLSKKEELSGIAEGIVGDLKKSFRVQYDETQSIGKRYRRQDEIGTPYCVTVDFETVDDKAVTVRDRDTMEQERVKIDELKEYLSAKLA